ncbi:MAG: hypothetical protein Unbinned1007contig1000_23 [Prokaryotic dsDNA virus sp.]|nr:MAG: hypothetical protein Unbinned1007contig1000_23 [Prokaryotic dsDNA virus sp.]
MADVPNYTIENNSGANVRIDLNSVFEAIQSSNSKSTDLATSQCVAGMHFLNTTTNILKIRNSANNNFTEIGNINTPNLGLLPRSGGTSAPMTGQFLADDSNSAGSPSISFDTDTDLGIFRKQANVMGFSSGGTEQMIFDANGITLRQRNEIRFGDSNSSNFTSLRANSNVSSNVTFTLPSADGSNGQLLSTNGSGVLSFTTLNFNNLNASNLTSGTIPNARFPATIPATTLNSTTVNSTTTKATQFRSNNSGTPVFQNSSGTESAAGRLVRMSVNFDSFRGGNANDNFTSIRRSFNVSSITDHGEGQFSVNFSTSLPSGSTTAGIIDIDRFTNNNHCTLYLENTTGAGTSSVRVRICSATNSGHVFDKNSVNVVCFA